MTPPAITTFTAQDAWSDAVAQAIAHALDASPSPTTLALAGGRTPAPIVARLGRLRATWDGIVVTPTDDRLVADDHDARNVTALRRALPAAAVVALESAPVSTRPDVVLLGFGLDRHVASVFPHGVGMADAARADDAGPRIVRATPTPLPAEAPFPRITYTLGTLAAARTLIIAARGRDKIDIATAACAEHPPASPLARLLATRGATRPTELLFLDTP